MKRLVYLAIFFLLPDAGAHPRAFRFERVPHGVGLSQVTVTCILQDSEGFIWIGTQIGLNRFDGSRFRVFKNDQDLPQSLQSNWIQTLFEDREGRLWVGTDQGLSRFDRLTETFVHFPLPGASGESLQPDVKTIAQDADGTLWAGSRRGSLFACDPVSGAVVHYRDDPGQATSVSHDRVSCV